MGNEFVTPAPLHAQRRRHCRKLLAVAGLWLACVCATAADSGVDTGLPWAQAAGTELSLDLTQFVQWTVLRNASANAARLQAEASEKLTQAERALYDPTAFSRLRRDVYDHPRTYEERTQSLTNVDKESALEQINATDVGVRGKLPSGATFELSHDLHRRASNLLATREDREYRGTLTLAVKQPLLRGAGRQMTEVAIRVAEKEQQIEQQRFVKQLLDTVGEAASTYWQLYRAQQMLAMRQRAVRSAMELRDIAQRLVDRGFAPRVDLLEADVAIGSRETEVARAQQQLVESNARVRNLLNMSAVERPQMRFTPVQPLRPQAPAAAAAPEPPPQLADTWPAYRIAMLRLEQEQIRLDYAKDLQRPDLSLELGYSRNSLSGGFRPGLETSLHNRHPGWYVGAALEMPVGNDGAREKSGAQMLKRDAARLQAEGEATTLGNEWMSRVAQLKAISQERQQLQQEVQGREKLLEAERMHYERGRARLRVLVETGDRLEDSRLRLLDADVRLQLAELSVRALTGRLLESFGVRVPE